MKLLGQESGSALVEFSLLLPMLVYLFVGIVDYALETEQTMQIMEAATAGASYGAINGNQKDFAGMQTVARNSAAGVPGFNVVASNVFTCNPQGTPVTSATTCAGYGTPIEYVKVTTSATIPTLLPFPGLPTSLTLQETASYRVPWTP